MNCLGLLVMGAVCEEKAEAWASPASPREKRVGTGFSGGGRQEREEEVLDIPSVWG